MNLSRAWPTTAALTPQQHPHQSDQIQRKRGLHKTMSYLINSKTSISEHTFNQWRSEKLIHAKIIFASSTPKLNYVMS